MRPDKLLYILLTKFLNKDFYKFLLIGGFNTILTYIIYLFFIIFTSYQIAYVISYCSGIFLVSILNVKFVFNKPISLKNSLKTVFVYIIQFVIGFIL